MRRYRGKQDRTIRSNNWPPALSEYAVEPMGVEKMTPSAEISTGACRPTDFKMTHASHGFSMQCHFIKTRASHLH